MYQVCLSVFRGVMSSLKKQLTDCLSFETTRKDYETMLESILSKIQKLWSGLRRT